MKTFSFAGPDVAPAPPNAIREVAFYDSIQDLPMFRLNEFQIHLSQDAGIGATLMDWDKRMEGVHSSLAANDTANAIKELYNARLGLFLLLDRVSTSARCLADLVYSLDGVPLSAFDDESMMRVHQRLMERMSTTQVSALVEELKKKFRRELKVGFQELFAEEDELEFYAKIIRRAKLQLEDYRAGAEQENPEIGVIDAWLRKEMAPENFDFSNPKNAVEEKRRSFEQVVTALALHGIQRAEELTAYKFHSRILYLHTHKPKPHESATHYD